MIRNTEYKKVCVVEDKDNFHKRKRRQQLTF